MENCRMPCCVFTLTESNLISENYSGFRIPIRRSHVNITRIFSQDEFVPFKRTKPLKMQRKINNKGSKWKLNFCSVFNIVDF